MFDFNIIGENDKGGICGIMGRVLNLELDYEGLNVDVYLLVV